MVATNRPPRVRRLVDLNDALLAFREISVLRGPSLPEFAHEMNMAGASSAQSVYKRLVELGWITRRAGISRYTPNGYVLTASGERRYRELIPNPEDRIGPEWPID